ncbi:MULTISPECIES: hypothetical protein [unclassified Kribbella]|uniref:hypothetical protein n=1 Tax=unclassified Kribbella TaxID=2644121 RepID=UPI00340FD244
MCKKVSAALSALAVVYGITTTDVPAAQTATTGRVSVVYGNWNCPNGGKVTAIQASNAGLWKTNWDRGDAVITPKVHLGQSNTINANLYCSATRARRGVYVYATNRTFTPTANDQTFWL